MINSVNKEKIKSRSLQNTTDLSEKLADSQSNHQEHGNKDYRIVIVRSKDNNKVFINPSRNLNMIQNSIFKDYVMNDADGIEVRDNCRSLKLKIKLDSWIENNNNLNLGQFSLNSSNTVGVIGSFDKELILR